MLYYVYIESYCDNRKIATATASRTENDTKTIPGNPQALLLNAKLAIFGEMWDISGLKALAEKSIMKSFHMSGRVRPSYPA